MFTSFRLCIVASALMLAACSQTSANESNGADAAIGDIGKSCTSDIDCAGDGEGCFYPSDAGCSATAVCEAKAFDTPAGDPDPTCKAPTICGCDGGVIAPCGAPANYSVVPIPGTYPSAGDGGIVCE